MHNKNHPHWDAAQRAMAAEKTAEEVLAALLGVETYAEVKVKLEEQREPDITMYLRSGTVYGLRAENATTERFYEDMRDAAQRAMLNDEAMSEINGRLRRELDTAEARNREIDALIAHWEMDGEPNTAQEALWDLKQVHQGHKRKAAP